MNRRLIVVMGGGGVKGLAHAGAWRAIVESGIEVTELVGTSIGALVAACAAAGVRWETLAEWAVSLRRQDIVTLNRWAFLLNGISEPNVFRDDAFRTYLETVVPVDRFDDLRLPLSVNAVHLETGRTEWFGEGGRLDVGLRDAVYASCALPLFYPPAEIDGELYVDGGVMDPLPVEHAVDRGADVILAIDVGAGPVKDSKDTVSKGMVAIHHRVFDIMAYSRKRALLDAWTGPPLVYVRPRLDGYSTFDFDHQSYFLEEGRRATSEALSRLDSAPARERLREVR
ncbi:MAG: patatin-like phospholipase family protein [Longimicrobiales bacterium]